MSIINDNSDKSDWEKQRLELMPQVSQELEILGDQNSITSSYIDYLEKQLSGSLIKIQNQRNGFEILLSIFESAGKFPKMEEVFNKSIGLIQNITGFPTIGMRFYDRSNKCFRLMASYGLTPFMEKELECLPEDMPYLLEVTEKKVPIFADVKVKVSKDMGYKRVICVPFIAANKILGTMELTTLQDYNWNDDELRWLKIIGHCIGILIYQAQIAEKLESLAVLRERELMAQELHDGLAQMIGAINVWIQGQKLALDEDDIQEARESTLKIEQVALEAYTYLREEMADLRHLKIPPRSILSEIIELTSRFEEFWEIRVNLTYDVHYKDIDDTHLGLTPKSEIQLLRVIQEGLTNIRRHAKAKSVQLHIKENEMSVMVTLSDDGIGFNIESAMENHLGLRIMRDRIDFVGGNLEVKSNSGEGTTLIIELPKHDFEEIWKANKQTI